MSGTVFLVLNQIFVMEWGAAITRKHFTEQTGLILNTEYLIVNFVP